MELKITTLIENMPDDDGELAFEHGLSLYIEFAGKKLLFDTGQTGEFLTNARKLGKSAADVDYMVVSHGHYDHSGGVMSMMEELGKVESAGENEQTGQESSTPHPIPMYVGAEFFDKKYKHLSDGSYRYNGNGFAEADLPAHAVNLHKITGDITFLEENIMLFKNFKRVTSFEKLNPKFVVERKVVGCLGEVTAVDSMPDVANLEPDDFRDELALGLCTSKGLVLVAGCSHVGIVNILQTVMERTGQPVYCVLGGTHLVEADEDRLDKTMKALREYGLSQIAVSHCTGEPGMERVEQEFGSDFVRNNTGHVYEI